MKEQKKVAPHSRWANFRFGVVGRLLVRPPPRGKLQEELEALAKAAWTHPTTGEPRHFGTSTIERWYYRAKNTTDPVEMLRRRVRSDLGKPRSLLPAQRDALRAQYQGHPDWSWRLHYDNLVALAKTDPTLGKLPSYATVRRHMKACGMRRRPRPETMTEGEARARARKEQREVRSYEMEHVNALWHADFHHGSMRVNTRAGTWETPHCLCVLDDRSRLVCHAQWYLAEDTENAVHGIRQAFLKRGLPWALMTDNGSAFIAAEMQQGLRRLSVIHEPTLEHSPYQNGKQEKFWDILEGRLMAMVRSLPDVTLQVLNEMTLAWVEHEYQVHPHTETEQTPLQRHLDGPDIGRPARSFEQMRDVFRRQERRSVRQGDGTVSIHGQRFEVPVQYRHLTEAYVAYAQWDLRYVHLVDVRNDVLLCRIHPLDRARNASGQRRPVPPHARGPEPTPTPDRTVPPLLRELLEKQARSGLPPAYLTKHDTEDES